MRKKLGLFRCWQRTTSRFSFLHRATSRYRAVQLGSGPSFCCILAKHGMGKSSLMARTAWRLQQQGTSTATLVMSGVTTEISMEQLSLWLIKRLKVQLKLSVDPDIWWANQTHHGGGSPFIDFLKGVMLSEVEGRYCSRVNLRRADLSDANLAGTNLRHANPREAKLDFGKEAI